ncbi:hypothetical protein [Alistipes sp.]|uniref:hypothetical protein n=1 Tax=Alistipes sp. TaxID=1872444 RepID=UPI003AEFCD21
MESVLDPRTRSFPSIVEGSQGKMIGESTGNGSLPAYGWKRQPEALPDDGLLFSPKASSTP